MTTWYRTRSMYYGIECNWYHQNWSGIAIIGIGIALGISYRSRNCIRIAFIGIGIAKTELTPALADIIDKLFINYLDSSNMKHIDS